MTASTSKQEQYLEPIEAMESSTTISGCSDTKTKSLAKFGKDYGNIGGSGGDDLPAHSANTNSNNDYSRGLKDKPRKMVFLCDNPSRVCRICHRHFSSGRALGGHMRIHSRMPVHQSMEETVATPNNRDFVISEDPYLVQQDEDESYTDTFSIEPESISDEEQKDQDTPTVGENNINGVVDSKSLLSSHRRGTHTKIRSVNPNMNSTAESVDLDRQLAMANSGSSGPGLKEEILLKLKRKLDKDGDFRSMEFLAGCAAIADDDVDYEEPARSKPVQARICCVCGKAFGTRKALFGHMRCHPERQWRGILPPADQNHIAMAVNDKGCTTNKARSRKRLSPENYSEVELNSEVENNEVSPLQVECSSLAGKNHVQDRSHVQKKNKKELADANIQNEDDINGNDKERCFWSCTGKRSRRKPASANFSSAEEEECGDDDDDDVDVDVDEPALTSETTSVELSLEHNDNQQAVDKQAYEAVNCLFLLAEAARKVEQERISERKNAEYDPFPNQSSKCNDAAKGKRIQLDEAQIVAASANIGDNENVREMIHVQQETCKEPIVASCSTATVVGSVTKYECTTCNRFFNSHQALGGHRASHRKTKGCFAKTSNGSGADEIADIHVISDQQSTEKHPSSDPMHKEMKKQNQQQVKGHKCLICHRIFPTGQALGGHKRCHWTSEKATEGSPSTAVLSSNIKLNESVPKGPSKTDEGGILDLNLPAPMDDSEDVSTAFASAKSDSAPQIGFSLLRQDLDTNFSTTSSPWVVKDLLGGHKRKSWNWTQPAKPSEDRNRLDGLLGRPQLWPANTSVEIPRIVSTQPF